DVRVVLSPRGAVGRRRGARVRPGGGGRAVVAQRDVDDIRERERLDPLGEVGRKGGGGGGSRPGRVARGALLRRSPEDVRGGRRTCDAADARWVGQAPAQRQRERRQRPRPGTARGRGLVCGYHVECLAPLSIPFIRTEATGREARALETARVPVSFSCYVKPCGLAIRFDPNGQSV